MLQRMEPTPKNTHPNKSSFVEHFSELFVQIVIPQSFLMKQARTQAKRFEQILSATIFSWLFWVGGCLLLGWVCFPSYA